MDHIETEQTELGHFLFIHEEPEVLPAELLMQVTNVVGIRGLQQMCATSKKVRRCASLELERQMETISGADLLKIIKQTSDSGLREIGLNELEARLEEVVRDKKIDRGDWNRLKDVLKEIQGRKGIMWRLLRRLGFSTDRVLLCWINHISTKESVGWGKDDYSSLELKQLWNIGWGSSPRAAQWLFIHGICWQNREYIDHALELGAQIDWERLGGVWPRGWSESGWRKQFRAMAPAFFSDEAVRQRWIQKAIQGEDHELTMLLVKSKEDLRIAAIHYSIDEGTDFAIEGLREALGADTLRFLVDHSELPLATLERMEEIKCDPQEVSEYLRAQVKELENRFLSRLISQAIEAENVKALNHYLGMEKELDWSRILDAVEGRSLAFVKKARSVVLKHGRDFFAQCDDEALYREMEKAVKYGDIRSLRFWLDREIREDFNWEGLWDLIVAHKFPIALDSQVLERGRFAFMQMRPHERAICATNAARRKNFNALKFFLDMGVHSDFEWGALMHIVYQSKDQDFADKAGPLILKHEKAKSNNSS